jgi:DNA invertase Pin-like site-specific DNA recombinase
VRRRMQQMKAAIYLRVSTDKQSVAAQRGELRELCKRRGWSNLTEYTDVISGAKFTRIGLDQMMNEIRRGRVDVVLCYKLDRLGRSLASVAQLIGEMISNKVSLVIPGQGIDTSSDNSAARLQLNILIAVAEFERDIIRERTKAGLAAARARGIRLGRPVIEISHQARKQLARFIGYHEQSNGKTYRALASELGLSLGKTHSLVRAARLSSRRTTKRLSSRKRR